jgi:hypothetical protein
VRIIAEIELFATISAQIINCAAPAYTSADNKVTSITERCEDTPTIPAASPILM